MTPPLTAEQILDFGATLREEPLPADDGELVDVIAALETVKNIAAATQADAAVALDTMRREREADQGVPARRRGRGVAAEVALARAESPHRGQTLLGLAKVLRTEMPHTHARLWAGDLSEYRALLLARETACLDLPDRQRIDAHLCADLATLTGVGTRTLIGRVRAMAAELNPAAMVRRARRAESERRVTIRPAPDTMCYLTALLPAAQGIAAYTTLTRDADRLRAQGDPRGKGQLMADLLTARTTGLPDHTETATDGDVPAPGPPAVPVTVNVVISDTALLAGDHAPASLTADGVPSQMIPADIARTLTAQTLKAGLEAWIRRLYTDPAGRLVALTSKQRFFPDGLADYLALRDQGICRTPWCDAPIRHYDHITAVADGGKTTAEDGQGLCEACNHSKVAPGWRQHTGPPRQGSVEDHLEHLLRRHTVTTRTPAGRTYHSTAPALPQPGRDRPRARPTAVHADPRRRLNRPVRQSSASSAAMTSSDALTLE